MGEERRRAVLIVDDEEIVRRALTRALRPAGYSCATAADARAARAELMGRSFDLILCDIQMPGDSGLVLLEEVSEQGLDTAIVMVTGEDDPATAKRAIAMGAYGYVVKPFTPNEILINVLNALTRLDLERGRRIHEAELETKLTERSFALGKAIKRLETHEADAEPPWAETIDRLARALTLRDEETGRHIERVAFYSELLAERRGVNGWTPHDMRHASMLHDVGKIGVPDAILTKPGPLNDEEMQMVRRHCELGYELLAGSDAHLLNLAASIALSHHEMWDGSGYPYGLGEQDIPIEGRIVSVADAFDAMTSKRVYRDAVSVDDAVNTMQRASASQFDPELVTLFVESLDEVMQILERYSDGSAGEGRIKVIVVDDQDLFAEGLSRLLQSAEDLVVVGRAGTVGDAVALAAKTDPDVAVIDWHLPDGTGADAARAIRSHHRHTRVVVLTGMAGESVMAEAIDAGCSTVLTKALALEEITVAIRSAHAGDVTIPLPKLSAAVARLPLPSAVARSTLTPRELEILGLLGEGLSNEAIAESLTLSLHTVRNHVQRIIMKLDAHSKLEAVARALRQGLIRVPQRFAAG